MCTAKEPAAATSARVSQCTACRQLIVQSSTTDAPPWASCTALPLPCTLQSSVCHPDKGHADQTRPARAQRRMQEEAARKVDTLHLLHDLLQGLGRGRTPPGGSAGCWSAHPALSYQPSTQKLGLKQPRSQQTMAGQVPASQSKQLRVQTALVSVAVHVVFVCCVVTPAAWSEWPEQRAAPAQGQGRCQSRPAGRQSCPAAGAAAGQGTLHSAGHRSCPADWCPGCPG